MHTQAKHFFFYQWVGGGESVGPKFFLLSSGVEVDSWP